MDKSHELSVTILEEVGYIPAVRGLSYNKNQDIGHIN